MPTLLLVILAQSSSFVTTTGYLDSRTFGSWTRLDGAPAVQQLFEGNIQLKLTPHEKVKFYTDTSLFWQGAWHLQGRPEDEAQYRPSVVLQEAYVDLPLHEHFRFLFGKKRIVWGAGLAFNPTDMLNPPKDPTDPTFQRAGAWLAQAEVGFERWALTVVGAARATRQDAGLPTGLIVYPKDAAGRDDEAHWALNARLYLLLADIDINVIYGFSNLYNDAFQNKSRFGLSVSRVFGDFEVHAEALVYTGSSRVEVNGACVDTPLQCAAMGTPVVERPYLESTFFNGRALAGARYQFGENAMVSLEYFFNGDGQDAEGFRKLSTVAVNFPQLAQMALAGSTTQDPGAPQKFTTEFLRRHYVTVQYSHPNFIDDWTVTATALVGLEDLSMQLVPQLQWSPFEWLQLTAALYVPVAGLETRGQFTLSPFQTRAMFQARAFF
jgi:hypothetical protein